MKPENLLNFLQNKECYGGWVNEAIELCLYDALKEKEKLTNIIIFSDSPSNSKQDTEFKRNYVGSTFTVEGISPSDYWNSTEFKDVKDYEIELEKIKDKKIPVFGFHVENAQKSKIQRDSAKRFFENISRETGGVYQIVNIQNNNEAERLAKLISEPILQAIGNSLGDNDKMTKMMNEFQEKYLGRSYV